MDIFLRSLQARARHEVWHVLVLFQMLKIWKQAWKREGSARKPQSGHDSDPDGQLSGTSDRQRTSVDATAAVPPTTGESVLVPVEPHGPSPQKRPWIGDAVADSPDHLSKKSKAEQSPPRDTLGNHLPEMAEDEDSNSRRSRMYAEIFEEEILEHAKRENSQFVSRCSRPSVLDTHVQVKRSVSLPPSDVSWPLRKLGLAQRHFNSCFEDLL
jgi:hypothetical protein